MHKNDFGLDPSVVRAISENCGRIKNVSRERITEELGLLLKTKNRSASLELCLQTGLWSVMFADVSLHLELAANMDHFSFDRWLAITLCTDRRDDFLDSLTLGRDTKKNLREAIRILSELNELTEKSLAERKIAMNNPAFDLALAAAQELYPKDNAAEVLAAEKVRFTQANTLSPEPLLSGADLKRLGFAPGPEMGAALSKIRRAQLNEEIVSKDDAEELAKKLLSPH